MLFHEQLTARRRPLNLKILATDVHKASLEVASAGHLRARNRSPASARSGSSASSRCKPNGYQISQSLRESIVFAPHNLIRDAPFTKLDLITCRNLLIYFQPQAQKTVLTLFHFGLKTGGFLFLGLEREPGRARSTSSTPRRAREDLPEAPRHRPAARSELPLPRAGAAPRACRAGTAAAPA